MSRDESDFLGRWSARKLKARTEPEIEAEEAAPAPAPADATPAGPEKTDEETLHELGLPDPEAMVKGDDFSAFMKAGVPLRLRNRALRKLWLSDPVLANLDGLNDYDEDYTDAATVVKGMKTAYKVGRGFLPDPEPEPAPGPAVADAAGEGDATAASEDVAAAEDAGDAAGDAAPAGREEAPVASAADESGAPAEDAPADHVPADHAPAEDAPLASAQPVGDVPPPPRRMRFRFADG